MSSGREESMRLWEFITWLVSVAAFIAMLGVYSNYQICGL